jgi:hypothetical protein
LKEKKPERRGTITCPECGQIALRKETRKTLAVRVPKIQLYECPKHQIECALYVVTVAPKGSPKKLLNRFSVKGARAQAIIALGEYDE